MTPRVCPPRLLPAGIGEGALPAGYTSLLAVAVDGVKDAFQAARWGLGGAAHASHCWPAPLPCVLLNPSFLPMPLDSFFPSILSFFPCSEYLGEGRAVHHLAAEWRCALPRGLQALMGAGPAAFPEGKPWDAGARAFGEQRLRGWADGALLAATRAAYEAQLAALLQRGSLGSPPADGQQQAHPQQQQQQHPQLAGSWHQQQQAGMVPPAGGAAAPAHTPPGSMGWQHEAQAGDTLRMEWAQPQGQQQQRQDQQQQYSLPPHTVPPLQHQYHPGYPHQQQQQGWGQPGAGAHQWQQYQQYQPPQHSWQQQWGQQPQPAQPHHPPPLQAAPPPQGWAQHNRFPPQHLARAHAPPPQQQQHGQGQAGPAQQPVPPQQQVWQGAPAAAAAPAPHNPPAQQAPQHQPQAPAAQQGAKRGPQAANGEQQNQGG